MRARIVGGVVAWAISLAPLVVVNLIAYVGLFTPDVAAVIGAVALVAGVALGAVTAGFLGGRAPDTGAPTTSPATPQRTPYTQGAPTTPTTSGVLLASAPRLGARGALASGGIAAALYALTMGGLIQIANAFDILPNIVTQHPIRITAAVLCVAAVFVGLAMLVGWWATRGATADDLDAEAAPMGARPGGAMSAPLGAQLGGAAAAMRGPVAPTRPLAPSPLGRGAAPATRPLTSAEINGPLPYGRQHDYGGQGAYGAYARPSQAASRPRLQSDPRYGAPANQSHQSQQAPDPRAAYPPRDPRDEYQAEYRDESRRDGDYRRDDGQYRDARPYDQRRRYDDRYEDNGYDGGDSGDDRYLGSSRERRSARSHRDTQRDSVADDYDDSGDYGDYDGYDGEADGWRRGDDRRRDSRAGARRPTRGHDRYDE